MFLRRIAFVCVLAVLLVFSNAFARPSAERQERQYYRWTPSPTPEPQRKTVKSGRELSQAEQFLFFAAAFFCLSVLMYMLKKACLPRRVPVERFVLDQAPNAQHAQPPGLNWGPVVTVDDVYNAGERHTYSGGYDPRSAFGFSLPRFLGSLSSLSAASSFERGGGAASPESFGEAADLD